MSYVKELQAKVAELEDGFDINSIELGLLENEMQDMLRPNILMMQLNQFVLQMLMELNEYQQKNKLTSRMQASKERLLKMLGITTELSGIGDKAQSFKLFNRELVGSIQMLRIENNELRKKNKEMQNAFEGL